MTACLVLDRAPAWRSAAPSARPAATPSPGSGHGPDPAGLGDWEPGDAVAPKAGTLMFFLEPPSQAPPGFAAKAARYGWPAEAELVPSWLAAGPDERPSDVSRGDVEQLSVAVAAVVSPDKRGPIVVDATTDTTTGQITLAGGQEASFSVSQSVP